MTYTDEERELAHKKLDAWMDGRLETDLGDGEWELITEDCGLDKICVSDKLVFKNDTGHSLDEIAKYLREEVYE